MTAEALGFWLKSGGVAAGRSAHKEAIEHFDRGLDLLKSGPFAAPERARWERLFLTAMGPSVMAIRGFGAAESQNVFQKAHDLLDDSTPYSDRLQILCGLWNIRFHHGEVASALPIAQQCLELARTSKAGLDVANGLMGQTLASMGEFTAALHHFQLIIDNYRTGKCEPHGRFLVDDHVLALGYTARILWALGRPLQAAEASREAMTLAREMAHPASVATALVVRLFMAVHGMPMERAIVQAREAITYCEEHELVLYQRWTRFLYGALLAQEDNAAAGIEIMMAAVSAAEISGHRTFRPFQFACIGAAHARIGNAERGLGMLGEAISMAEAQGEQQSLATIHRFRGDILSGAGQHQDAERAFEAALAIARRQGHRIEELRIAMAMVRSETAPENAASARSALEGLYATFEEGHTFPDLQAARDLLHL
jgi:tetratricopeptide (TPR) repeat protein